jgi:hypothetical protein
MKLEIIISLVCLGLVGCKDKQKQSQLERLEDAAFDAGVQCAIHARYMYVKDCYTHGDFNPKEIEIDNWANLATAIRSNFFHKIK